MGLSVVVSFDNKQLLKRKNSKIVEVQLIEKVG